MDITIPIPNDKADIIKNALGYADEIIDKETHNIISNPETPKQFILKYIKRHIKGRVNDYNNNLPENKSDFQF